MPLRATRGLPSALEVDGSGVGRALRRGPVVANDGGEGAHAELASVLGYVQARVLPQACAPLPLGRNAVHADGLIADETTVHAVTGALAAVLAAVDAADTQSQ